MVLTILPIPGLYPEDKFVHFHPSNFMGDSGSQITSDIINPTAHSRNDHFYSPQCELKLVMS